MNIAFRVDADSKIGIGHLKRCLSLATQIKKKN
jgi:spore coat polysaccharide biosynthesis predicted glycosyltransferase SpsG